MPYRTRKWGRRSYTRRTTRPGYGGRVSRRRYPARRRRYPRKMTNKRILNVTSHKKKDNMCNYSNTTPANPGGSTTYSSNAAVLVGGQTYIFPWIASARPGGDVSSNPGVGIEMSNRTSNVCYMRGLKEKIQFQTSTGMAWQWRRICFTAKGNRFYQNDSAGYRWSLLTSAGVVRVVNNIAGTAQGSSFVDAIFDGQNGVDWVSPFTARVDRDIFSVKYDKTTIIQSGNDTGVMRNYNRWHAMNKNLVFDDDESGDSEIVGRYSNIGKQGMGDYYVIDIIAAGTGSSSADQASFQPEATLYWHEK
ncbi:capsid protein [Pteropus associated gemycircularvirus 3]|uniref:Capsid protein n=1 Tax=Pteropus associated gemycircularvirus 3 TaxID=1985397 RepID=A0A140CTM3_9VIRU|nr:capsid protein [Pteropus associated gemycircularvirus 3]AMH87680.1 capsid protein [Pteropus associated gemycircularvirus 3]